MQNPVVSYKNFLDEAELKYWISAIDRHMENESLIKRTHGVPRRDILPCGIDGKAVFNKSLKALDKDEINATSLANRVMETVYSSFKEDKDLYLTSFWLCKQYPGSMLGKHEDTDSGFNMQNIYSAVIYLNTLKDSGAIVFNKFDYKKYPTAGDLIVFKSQGTGTHEVEVSNEIRYTIPIWFTDDKNYSLT